MVATSAIGHGMEIPRGRYFETSTESGTFVVRFSNEDDDIRGTRLMARADQSRGVAFDSKGNNQVNGKQYDALLRSGISHEVVSAPASFKPPVVKIQRK